MPTTQEDGMGLLSLICYVVALVLFAVAAFGVALPRVQFGWLGAAFFTLAVLLSGASLS